MSARRDWLDFQLGRLRGFVRQFRKSKRGLIGVSILVFYVSFAVFAPFITPYDPLNGFFVSGQFAHPAWWSQLPDGSKLSQNYQLFDHPGFASSTSFADQGWVVQQSPPGSFSVNYNSTQTIKLAGVPPKFPGSQEIDYSRAAGSAVPPAGALLTLSKPFTWPYTGPPDRFVGQLQFLLTAMQGVDQISISASITRLGNPIKIWQTQIGNNSINRATDPELQLDSHSSEMRNLLGSTTKDPAREIFFEKGTYSFDLHVQIPDVNQAKSVNVKLAVNAINLKFFGTSWGLLGTDQYGRDIFSQLAWGTRVSLIVGLVASILAVAVGLAVGLVAGYLGRAVDEVLMRTTDLVLVLPGLPLLIVLTVLFQATIWNVIWVLAFLGWPGFARIIRSQVLSLKERPFIEASKAAGSGVFHIITKHVVPNVMGLTYVNLALSVPTAIVSEAALAFLGISDPTVISWGKMLNDVQSNYAISSWWWVLPPGLSIAALSLAFVLLGYALDELLNPKLRMRR